ncbi:TetR/AcrR family transcriptional regulator C-terminal ligand-binding domain-containing protein [Frankia sp. CNm7]|uniref:TetR/AcrR family transcriptional regulator C-terminal ligand-binding domain-containing protein n=1 Tax=Frankia nepalensis TaxID=1836974 RepID=A0A937RUW2_9ACTN|nr:TetR-like C-terminal domain-containing protein [Frankia nepalensis]MBL7497605.1 TetR/AcrR family transcriptional regulator C-terminal ligand-binding domain-containing protein [Frankia nepalensis]MBL7511791.1 TetR/AcrR family transcriptional regulator C-terminal ligand-binding domain-containing protein [Frankia nepalensis]MBL7518602.1 TetR/AcrR family transcriptional regulator C-terminal ligand-binding domain-containing protein [Frankia nepalensis]MBL7633263.1 TetR/AcrR family transcriptional
MTTTGAPAAAETTHAGATDPGATDPGATDPGATGSAVAAAPATRRRGSALETAIFQAVLDQLGSVGYARLTMDGVAAAAHTGKAALYRRWQSKEDLVLATVRHLLPAPSAVRLTGDLRVDLLALLGCVQRSVNSTHGAVLQMAAVDAGADCQSLVGELVMGPCESRILEVLRAGAARGVVRAEAVSPLVAQIGPAMILRRSMVDSSPVPDPYLASIVDDVLLALCEAGR